MLNITSKGDELLETRLNESTNPLNTKLNTSAIESFCQQILNEPEGCQIAIRLLAHKVQSPQEKESLYSFDVIDECVKKCGAQFHKEVAKFRFLNELIKIVSPKYLASNTSMAVKKRCIECLYSLYKSIPHEGKLKEAYDILKNQKIITKDPTYMDDKIFKVSVPETNRTKSIFETSKDSKRLEKLLLSRKPEDLKEANRIIRNVVLADNNKIEQISRRQMKLDVLKADTANLKEMLSKNKPGQITSDDLNKMKDLVENLEMARSDLFKLTRDSNDDEAMKDIAMLIEECNVTINKYWNKTNMIDEDQDLDKNSTDNQTGKDLLGDVSECDLFSADLQSICIPDNYVSQLCSTAEIVIKSPPSKYDELMNIFHYSDSRQGKTPINGEAKSPYSSLSSSHSSHFTNQVFKENTVPNIKPVIDYKGFEELDILSQELLNLSKKQNGNCLASDKSQDFELMSDDKDGSNSFSNDSSLLCNILTSIDVQNVSIDSVFDADNSSLNSDVTNDNQHNESIQVEESSIDLNNIDIKLSDVKPHPVKTPIVIYSNPETKVKVTLYFAIDGPHQGVTVLVSQIVNESIYPITDIVLKFAVAKPIKIRKLKGPISSLHAHSPFTPSSPINEIVLLYHPNTETVDLKYQLSYDLSGESFLESTTQSIHV